MKKLLPKLRSLAPVLFVMIVSGLLLGMRVYADTTNFFTGCIKNSGTHNLYNVQLGTSPSSPCSGGDTQISADYGDITGVTAGTGLSGGATQGAAVLSLADNGVTTVKIASSSVTAVKINSESATNGKVLTANGSGGATWQTPASGASWGSITGTLASQTDLQNALNTKQDKLVAISDKHSKALVNNTDNDLFTFSLADGEGVGMIIYFSGRAKKGTDWALATGSIVMMLYNDGGTLQKRVSQYNWDLFDNAGAVRIGNVTLNATLSSGVVTFELNPGDVGISPDSIDLDYVLHNPDGKTLTFLP